MNSVATKLAHFDVSIPIYQQNETSVLYVFCDDFYRTICCFMSDFSLKSELVYLVSSFTCKFQHGHLSLKAS